MRTLRSMQRDERWPRVAGMACVTVAHALALAVLLAARRDEPPVTPTAALQVVRIDMDMIPAAPPAPAMELPPGPPRRAQAASAARASRPAKVPPTPSPLPAQHAPAQSEEVGQAEASAVASQAVDQSTAPPHVEAAVAARLAAPVTSAAVHSQAEVTWQGMLLGHLKRFRRYPRMAERARQSGVAYVRFAVTRQGDVIGPRVERSSGYTLLDEESVETAQRASPVPPPPAQIPGDPVDVLVPVEFFLSKH
ncbi:protein TonB [Luteibacter sp. Sphag1AF]|uniref:energy transducer TonB n=1 Tax=Luteibacter sp. Sphag1AF TaxID=2587031 RepID=UPI00179B8CDF|nr:energy transducer TonB [Luteibacter sp. Sphag1AF]MBB3226470.1 protein TonB [Luteibacter sp. Sphag1AF]